MTIMQTEKEEELLKKTLKICILFTWTLSAAIVSRRLR